jgi:histidine decarboxylase
VEKAGLIGLVKLRYIESDDELSMRGKTLAAAIAQDREKGLIPFFVNDLTKMSSVSFDGYFIFDFDRFALH